MRAHAHAYTHTHTHTHTHTRNTRTHTGSWSKESIGGEVPVKPARPRRGDTSSYTRTRTRTHAHAHTHAPRARAHGQLVKAEHWRGGATAVGAPATWRYILRCAQFLVTLSTHCISHSVPSPSSRSASARASPLFPCWPSPRHTHTQSRPSDHPFLHQVTTPMTTWT
jgi:hypothetical protein